MLSETPLQGPGPSGSSTFHVRVIIVPTSDKAGVYVAFAKFRFGLNVPIPPVQVAPLLGVALSDAAVVPQTILSGPAFAVVGVDTVTVMLSVEEAHTPSTLQVSVIVVPISDTAGV